MHKPLSVLLAILCIIFSFCAPAQAITLDANQTIQELQLGSQAYYLFDITHRDDACHDGEQDDRSDYKLDKIQEDRSKGFDVRCCKVCLGLQQESRNNCKDQSNENLCSKGQFPGL